MNKATIKVFNARSGRKDFTVDAELIGAHLAVHRAIELKSKNWAVTHVASGGVVVHADSHAQARQIAKALSGLPWEKVRSLKSRKALAEIGPLRVAILAEFGL